MTHSKVASLGLQDDVATASLTQSELYESQVDFITHRAGVRIPVDDATVIPPLDGNPQRGIPEDKRHKEAVMGDRKPDILLVESLTPTRSLLGIYGASVRPSWR